MKGSGRTKTDVTINDVVVLSEISCVLCAHVIKEDIHTGEGRGGDDSSDKSPNPGMLQGRCYFLLKKGYVLILGITSFINIKGGFRSVSLPYEFHDIP